MSFLSKIIGSGIGDAVKSFSDVIDKFVETPEEKNAAKVLKEKFEKEGERFQTEINKIEAGHRSIFVAGWRPAIGWICSAGLAIHYILNPLILWIATLIGKTITVPELDIGTLMPLVLSLLGIGTLRTFEKSKGVTK